MSVEAFREINGKENILSCRHVDICYGSRQAVHDVSFDLGKGEILGIVGESGSGKSTLLKALLGLLGGGAAVTRGDIWYGGNDIPDLSEKELRKIRGAEIGMIFQDSAASFCPVRTIGSQLKEILGAHGRVSAAEAEQRSLELFSKLGLNDGERVYKSYPFELSGGMNQRAGIAAAMLPGPKILLADEPTSALDAAVQKQVLMEMKRVRDIFGTAIIFVSHDMRAVEDMADTIMVLKDGHVMEYGDAKTVLNTPANAYTAELLEAVPRLRRV